MSAADDDNEQKKYKYSVIATITLGPSDESGRRERETHHLGRYLEDRRAKQIARAYFMGYTKACGLHYEVEDLADVNAGDDGHVEEVVGEDEEVVVEIFREREVGWGE
ncbi:MAG: hypothetical protein LQ344_008015 [Seirophora lacunosa]|nr:MAG: hypothetical protein LQ344_008015 [Seirophora lacunosa]